VNPTEAQMAGLIFRLALEGFTTKQVNDFVAALTDMGWRLVPPDDTDDDDTDEAL